MALFDETFSPYVPFGSRNLTTGSQGTDVAVLQAVYNLMLKTMNPEEGPMGSAVDITGVFDSRAVTMVKNIQSYFGLLVDGIVGPETYGAFGQGVGHYASFGGPVFGSRSLQEGDSGGDVTILQNRLNGFSYSHILGGPATGAFDDRTALAVQSFKQHAERNGDTGFPSNPIAGFGFYDASWLYTFAGGRAIERGRNGFDVVFIQVILKNLGIYAGRITGYYLEDSVEAVKVFQDSQGISIDGIVGPVTFYHIGLNNMVNAPGPLGIAWPTAPSPKASVCSVPLVSQTQALHPYGVAALVINEMEGFESLDVVGNMLNPPAWYGLYDTYQFSLNDPDTGHLIETEIMRPVGGTDDQPDYAGTYSPGVKSIPKAIVTVHPYNSLTTQIGMPVLRGVLKSCH